MIKQQGKKGLILTSMKLKKSNLFLLFSTCALLLLLVIQVYWILQTAKIKEDIFNEKANMVLSKTAEALSSDKVTCGRIGECVDNDGNTILTPQLAKNDVRKIDSLLNHFMRMYNIHIDYTFNIVLQNNTTTFKESAFAKAIYKIPLEDIAIKKGVDINLSFPDKKQYVIAEMGLPFFTSIILIVTIIIIFWKTNVSLHKEKRIAAHTIDFLNNMTHEFKTPLSNIGLAAKMVTKEGIMHNEEKLKHYTAIIIEEKEKLGQQIEQILNLNALERDEITIMKNKFDAHELIKQAIKCMHMQIEHNDAQIIPELKATQFNITGDKEQFCSVLCNLIDNALKYAVSKPVITIQTYNQQHRLMLVVTDNGKGIAKEYQKEVFEKYFRVPTYDVHNVKGFGLGLAFIKRIVELHQGDITLQSEPGKGSTFTLSLPYA